MVVFGTRGRRVLVYERSRTHLNRICKELEIEEIVDIGRPIGLNFTSDLHARVVAHGELQAGDASRLLLDAIAGVVDYPVALLGKSGVFAAYCAYRLVPIVANFGDEIPADGLERDRHYWLTDIASEKLNLGDGQCVADQAHAWYHTHNLEAHARALAACLF